MEEPKGYEALLLIIAFPCITFILAMTLLGIAKPLMQGLGNSIHPQAIFPLVPHVPLGVLSPTYSSLITKVKNPRINSGACG